MGHRDLRDRSARCGAFSEDLRLQLRAVVAPGSFLDRSHRVHDLVHAHDRCRLRPRIQGGMAARLPSNMDPDFYYPVAPHRFALQGRAQIYLQGKSQILGERIKGEALRDFNPRLFQTHN
jgi:hypothetical protein